MSPKSFFTFLVSIGMISLTACNLISGTDKKESGNANMPNPASVFCEENGGVLEIRTADDGSQSGVCVFPDDSECDEWAFFRSECKPGDSQAENPVTAVELADDGCTIYRDKDLKYSFHYPSDAIISENDEPTRSFTIQGPVFEENYWPVIMIAHPQDREEYRPPEGSNLEKWLADHNLIDAETYDVIEIAGTSAVHTRFESGGQSYNNDHYFFAYKDQLYSIVILHTSGKEDWDLYNHFLDSFEFDQ